MSEYTDWLDSLGPGDKVAVAHDSFGNVDYEIETVSSVSPKRRDIKTTSRINYVFRNGYASHDMGRSVSIVPVTHEVIERIKRARLLRRVKRVDMKTLTTEQLGRIWEVMNE